MLDGLISGPRGGRSKQLQEFADILSFLVGGETKANAGLVTFEGLDLGVDLETFVPEVEGYKAASTDGNGMDVGTAETGFTDVDAYAEDDAVAHDEVHGHLCFEAGETV
jgi:hypothetical protein